MRRILVLFATATVVAGACATDDPADSVEITTETETGAITWQQFGPDSRVQTGNLDVPVDYDDPSAGTFDLFLARHRAPDASRIGSLLVNPGGPGFGGADYAIYANQVFSEKLLERFDIVGWDPRGTGLTEPAIDCVDDYDRFYTGTDITPDDDGERQQLIDLAEEFAAGCVRNNGDILAHITTNSTARDMDAIRQALGEDTISYFGFSYGSELGATWATLFPATVRAAVLDGAADPTAGFTESGVQQAAGFERTLVTFLAQCSDDPDCAFHNDGDAERAFDELMLALDDQPIPSREGRPDVTRGVAINAVALAMYSESYWDQLEQALSNAQFGDGGRLLDLHDQYFQRRDDGTWDNALEAFQAIVCMDDAERLSVADDDAAAEQYRAVAPRFAPNTTGSYFCTFFPPSADPRVEVSGAGAGPILVMGTTGDPATPLSSTEVMADALEDGRLVIVDADQHTGYGVNQCAYDVIDDYLIDPVNNAPVDGFRCD